MNRQMGICAGGETERQRDREYEREGEKRIGEPLPHSTTRFWELVNKY